MQDLHNISFELQHNYDKGIGQTKVSVRAEKRVEKKTPERAGDSASLTGLRPFVGQIVFMI